LQFFCENIYKTGISFGFNYNLPEMGESSPKSLLRKIDGVLPDLSASVWLTL